MLASFIHSKMKALLLALLVFSVSSHTSAQKAGGSATGPGPAAGSSAAASEYFTVEDYYRVKWGHAYEFIALWKANHYPLLKKAQEKGDMISMKAQPPRLHAGEETPWDFSVTVLTLPP